MKNKREITAKDRRGGLTLDEIAAFVDSFGAFKPDGRVRVRLTLGGAIKSLSVEYETEEPTS